MANKQGDFIWYELLTTDVAAAAKFYAAVIGWQCQKFESSDRDYYGFSIGGAFVGGAMTMPAGACEGGPTWLGYVGVESVDASVADIVKAGGKLTMPAFDIPGVGRLAMLADPQGAPFYVMRGASDATSTVFAPGTSGHCAWNELTTSDQNAALAFYSKHFGWQKGDAMPMGERGSYQFLIQNGVVIGAISPGMDDKQKPRWRFYFAVDDIDVAHKAVLGNSGTVMLEPMEVPGGRFIVIASDPQGAVFGVVGPRKA